MAKIYKLDTKNSQNICYWCGKKVLDKDGAREHLIPRTILQDTTDDISSFVVSKKNAHKICNLFLGKNYEHDFCQILFHYSFGDQQAYKHNQSKIRNLKKRPIYIKNQFSKMKKMNGKTEIKISDEEKKAFEKVITKIIKGLYFKKYNNYLDTSNNFTLKIIWNTLNCEYDNKAKEDVEKILKETNDQKFIGNNVVKYRVSKTMDSESFIWEIVFYDRFPVYVLLKNYDKQLI